MKDTFSSSSFVGGLALGVFATFLVSHPFSKLQEPSIESNIATTTEMNMQSGAIAVLNQDAGLTVSIESVTVPPPGVWIAVREVNMGTLGNILGAVKANGPHSNISVLLLRATAPKTTYAVELYRDNGDSLFNFETDSVYVDFTTGKPVISYFKTN